MRALPAASLPAMCTSRPGLGNAMGALYNAKFYGSPVLITAGQQEQGHGLMEPMLYDPLVPIAQPMVKWAVEVNARAGSAAHRAARSESRDHAAHRSGIHQSARRHSRCAKPSSTWARPTRVDAVNRPSDAALERLAARMLESRNPVLIAGHELQTRDALQEAAQLAETLGAAVMQQTVPYAAHFFSEHPAFVGQLTRSQHAGQGGTAAVRSARVPRRRCAAHVGAQPDRSAARRRARGADRRARLGARQELPGANRDPCQCQRDAARAGARCCRRR